MPIVSWKFRTMVKNADELKKTLMHNNEMTGPMFKLTNDPRILPVGHFLRKYSLDELPQLFSVLKGDLSLVGPRPPLQTEFKEFDLWHRRKLSVKPGLTCLWQISGRNKISNFDDWAKLDLEYIDKWSIWLDLKILLKTIPAVLSGKGAK
jgi:lipopolysaccharide/colanic/teichoic acid biosynthesis glycosyltransferase